MTGVFMFLHALVCVFLAMIILMQSGRGGGLTEGFAAAESIFGAKTSSFLVKTTAVLACAFLITCLSLAILSSQSGRSLMVAPAAVSGAEGMTVPKTQPAAPSVDEKAIELLPTNSTVQ